ncbi:hypothetical protein EV2_027709 [Malus domestica]
MIIFKQLLTFSKLQNTKNPKKAGSNVGPVSHSDKDFNTILHQNHVNGLEINTKDDEWIMFDPRQPSSFLFIASDIFKSMQSCELDRTMELAEGYTYAQPVPPVICHCHLRAN